MTRVMVGDALVFENDRLLTRMNQFFDRIESDWGAAFTLAGLGGVLIAPLYAQVSSIDFFALLMSAVAAAVAASLTSIPIAMAAGLALGVLQAQLTGFLPANSALATGL